jgi:hypothetical protein
MLGLYSCQKEKSLTDATANAVDEGAILPAMNPGGSGSTTCYDDRESITDNIETLTPTILGIKLYGNPYSLSIMQQAAQAILGTSSGVTINAKYMRFKPSDADQLATLEDNDIDLFDYPLDYEVVQEGDYYDDGSTPAETIPWLYAVVPTGFIAPAGITTELLQQIHVPVDYRVEKKAFEITGNYIDDAGCNYIESRVPECPDVCNPNCADYDPTLCVGGGGNLPPISNARIPSGSITVTDDVLNTNVAVRKARVVARRFLKIDRTFTNAQGNYQFTKSFRNKVKLIVKFKNNDAIIKGMRGARFWQLLLPVKINIGTYRGNLNNIPYNVATNTDPLSRGARHWAAAMAHNSVQEYHEYAATLSIGVPPQKTRIVVSPFRGVSGAAPMYAKRTVAQLGENFVKHNILGRVIPGVYSYYAQWANAYIQVFKGRIDMVCGYNIGGITRTANQFCETMFHELTHAAHFNKVGNNWYNEFVEAQFNETVLGPLSPGERPYGDGTSSRAGYVGLGESWAYHMGHTLMNTKYGGTNVFAFEQGFAYNNGNIFEINNNAIIIPAVAFTGLNAHLNLLEDFSPLRFDDPFSWIPQGLFYDLQDDRNDGAVANFRVPLNDDVVGYTNQQFFNAIDADVTTIPQYRGRLLLNNGNNQIAGVNRIFTFYGF